MNNENLPYKILEKIKNSKIKPIPKWEFVLRDYFIIALAVIALILGSFAFAVIIYMMRNNDWDIYRQVSGSLFKFLLASLPYLWLIFLAMFVFLVYHIFRQTKSGYRYRLAVIILTNIVFSILLGLLFYGLGFGRILENKFQDKVPFYREFMERGMQFWHQPAKGIISGQIVELYKNKEFSLIDLNHNQWLVLYDKASLSQMLLVMPGIKVRVLGEKIGEWRFDAYQLRPLMPWHRTGLPQKMPPIFERKNLPSRITR